MPVDLPDVVAALAAHPKVAEAAVFSYAHELKAQGLCACVRLNEHHHPSHALARELARWVRRRVGPWASLDRIEWVPSLPKARDARSSLAR